jgi:hypothetical protein
MKHHFTSSYKARSFINKLFGEMKTKTIQNIHR